MSGFWAGRPAVNDGWEAAWPTCPQAAGIYLSLLPEESAAAPQTAPSISDSWTIHYKHGLFCRVSSSLASIIRKCHKSWTDLKNPERGTIRLPGAPSVKERISAVWCSNYVKHICMFCSFQKSELPLHDALFYPCSWFFYTCMSFFTLPWGSLYVEK